MPSARLFYSTVFYANRDVVGVDVAFYVQFSGEEEKWKRDERREVLRCIYSLRIVRVIRFAIF
jgi:hypothetical protein